MENSLMEIKAPIRRRRKQYLINNSSYLPQVLQEDILVRLPVKVVVRFKSVCKTWRCIIESRRFRNSYSRRHRHKYSNKLLCSPLSSTIKLLMKSSSSSPALIGMIKLTPGPPHLRLPQKLIRLKRPDQEFCEPPLDEEELLRIHPAVAELRRLTHSERQWRRVVRVMGPSSNGIYLVVNYFEKGFAIGQGRGILFATSKLALCNPAIHDYKYISVFPPDDYDSTNPSSISYYLAQRPCRVHYGFGQAQADADYKVIVVIGWGSHFNSFLSFVYSLKRGTWRKLVDYEAGKRHYCDFKAVEGLFLAEQERYPEITKDLELCPQRFFRDCWHWMTVRHTNKLYTIMLFDFADDTFKLMDAPHFYCRLTGSLLTSYVEGGGLFVFNDHLAAIFYTPKSIHVWMTTEYGVGESWTRIYDVQHQPELHRLNIDRLVGISSQEDDHGGGYGIKTIFFVDNGFKTLFSVDAASGHAIEHGCIDTLSGIWWNTLGISTYLETLESLDC